MRIISYLIMSFISGYALAFPAPVSTCTGRPIIEGIDVSDFQAKTDWKTVEKTTIGFAFIKATQGVTFISSTFKRDWAEAKLTSIHQSAYHYFMGDDDAQLQAENFLKTLGPIAKTDMPAMLDWEESAGASPAVIIARAKIWLEVVEKATGKIPIIYTGPNYWHSIGNPAGFERYPLYIADWTSKCPEIPAPWKTWTFWQYGEGALAGVTSKVDYDVFNGNATDLEHLVIAK